MSKVLKGICAVMGELAKEGIAKGRRNQQQGYAFRGIDDIYNTLSTLLASNGLVIYPEVISRKQEERRTVKGGILFYSFVEVKYHVAAAEDGSEIICVTHGEAMDSADKSTNKAMSAAYKYLCLQLFCIPTEGDNDADATTPEQIAPQPVNSSPYNNQIESQKPAATSPVSQYKALLEVKGLYTPELVNAFNAMTLEKQREEFARVKGL